MDPTKVIVDAGHRVGPGNTGISACGKQISRGVTEEASVPRGDKAHSLPRVLPARAVAPHV